MDTCYFKRIIKYIFIFLFILLNPYKTLPGSDIQKSQNHLKITFLSSEGFLISCSDKSVLFDALYNINVPDGKPPRLHEHLSKNQIKILEHAQKPFDNVSVVFTTHSHDDHFTGGSAAEFLKNSPDTYFVCPFDAAEEIRAVGFEISDFDSRVKKINAQAGITESIRINGINIKVLGLLHSGHYRRQRENKTGLQIKPTIQHQAYLVFIENFTILHLGDTDAILENFDSFKWLSGEKIDVAFVPYWFFLNEEGVQILKDIVNAAYLIPMHFNIGNRNEAVRKISEIKGISGKTAFFSKFLEKKTFSK